MPLIGVISGGNTRLQLPEGIALDSSGKINVANPGIAPDYAGSITIFRHRPRAMLLQL